MFSQILIALDMSDLSQGVFEQGLSLGQKYGAHLRLLHVLSSQEEDSPLPIPDNLKEIYPAQGNDLTLETWREEWHDFEAQGEAMLRSRVKEAQQAGLEADWLQLSGSPGKVICHVAQQWPADVIAIGHRGRSGLSELFLGSVSNYVLHHAPCSILTLYQEGSVRGAKVG